jgi:hypothetical protein
MENKLISSLILFIIFVAALPYSVGAVNENNFLQNTSSGNVFGGGNNFQINQDVQGDLVLAGSELEINGNIVHDFIGAGGELTVNGNVSGNIIAAGGTVNVNGNVDGDVVAFGGQILLARDSVVKGDILLGGGEITLDGIVNGNGNISTGTLYTGDNFKLKGDLKLKAENYPSKLKDQVEGNLNITTRDNTKYQATETSKGSNIFTFIAWLLMSLALGLVLIYIFPGFMSRLKEIIGDSPLKTGLLGLLVLIFLPILAIILLITFFGLSLSILLILLLALGLLIATIPVKLLVGEIIYNKIFKKEAGKLVYYLIGAIIFAIVYEIPLLGGIIRFIALLIGLGAIVVWLGEHVTPGTR